MRKLLIGGALAALVVSLAACGRLEHELGGRGGPATAGGSLGDRPDREELPRGDDDEGHRPDDEPVGAERDLDRRSRGDRDGRRRDPAVLAREVGRVRAREPLVSDHPRTSSRSRSTATGARCTSSATTSTSRRARSMRSHGRRSRRGADRRTVADHQHGGRIDHADRLSPCRKLRTARAREAPLAEQRRRAEPGRQSARPRGRPPAGQGPHQAADRVRRHGRAARRGRPARAARPRAVERPGRGARGAPGTASAYGQLQSEACSVRAAPRGERRRRTSTRSDRRRSGRPPPRSAIVAIDQAIANARRRIGPRRPRRRLGSRRRRRTRTCFAGSGRRAAGSRR